MRKGASNKAYVKHYTKVHKLLDQANAELAHLIFHAPPGGHDKLPDGGMAEEMFNEFRQMQTAIQNLFYVPKRRK